MALPALVEPAAELSRDEIARYSRHLIIPDVAMDGQKRLKNARVLLIGAGGLGAPNAMYLAAAGVGHLGLVDFDVVDASNLQRQVIHGTSDIGRPKLESARDKITEINPYVQVTLHETRLSSENARELVRDYDLVVDGSDNFPTRYLVNDACVLEGKPYVWAPSTASTARPACSGPSTAPATAACTPSRPAGHGPLLRRGRGPGRALRHRRLGPGQRGRQAALWHRRPAGRAAADLRRPGAVLQGHQRPQGPRMRRLREEPHGHRLIDYEAFCGVVSDEAQQAAAGATSPRPSSRRCSTTASSSSWWTSASRPSGRSTACPGRP